MQSKKDLKAAYKEMKPRMGVFQIRNTANGKIFVGSNTNLDAIWNRHRFALNFGSHTNAALQADWKTYGENFFEFEILAEVKHKDDPAFDYRKELKMLEALFLEELKPFGENGYN
ncbi:MAG: GIY-YIG nuclease family protein [Lewinellaceae bacterium]|nr:GIY-YIG nuclease family protein [Saprospiraceae bacterium]MCB9338890.1 GIY-YIG nuclease family protein [Lewinellaceae bacterium]